MDFDNVAEKKKKIKKKDKKYKKNFGKMFKSKIHIPFGGNIETMLLPKTVTQIILSDLPHPSFSLSLYFFFPFAFGHGQMWNALGS